MAKRKNRNYSFKASKKLPESKMTDINGIRIPSMPGSCYHATMCALASCKNKLVSWDKMIELTQQYMIQYGGQQAWDKFKSKSDVKTYEERIKDNVHTLTRTGKDCYGFRLHERGMAIYFFRDGAQLLIGGTYTVHKDGSYSVDFSDGRGLQVRYRGTAMTSKEYKRFLELSYIDQNARIVDLDGIRKFRSRRYSAEEMPQLSLDDRDDVRVRVLLGPDTNQNTAIRLEQLGLVVDEAVDGQLYGSIHKAKLDAIKTDRDIELVEVIVD